MSETIIPSPLNIHAPVVKKSGVSEGFDPAKSTVSEEKMTQWLSTPLSDDLLVIPGVGEKNLIHLKTPDENGDIITTQFQLIAKFLSFKTEKISQVELLDKFYYWLKDGKKINHQTNNICQAIAERCNIMIPGCYDASVYQNK